MEFLSLKIALKGPASLQCYTCVVSLGTCSSTTQLDSELPHPTTAPFSTLLTPNSNSPERTLLKNWHGFTVVILLFSELPNQSVSFMIGLCLEELGGLCSEGCT